MQTLFLNSKQLRALWFNARAFAGYYVHWKKIGPDRFEVNTNYAWIPEEV